MNEDGWYRTKRKRWMRFPERPEGTHLLFYNIHLPGRKGNPGTPVGVVALLFSSDLDKLARGIAVRSLLDEWDAGEGRIRAAGRAIRAYRKHERVEEKVAARFTHDHGRNVAGVSGFNDTKYVAPAVATLREYKLLEKRFGKQIVGSAPIHTSHGGSSGSAGM